MKKLKSTWLALLLSLNALVSCQLVLGDVQIDDQVGAGVVGVCEPGDYRCNAEYLLSCGSSHVGWTLDTTCNSADLCDSTLKQCQQCEPDELRCQGALRQQCNATGSGWIDLDRCESEKLCNPRACGPCAPGEHACRGQSGAELWECVTDSNVAASSATASSATGTWSQLDTCESAGLCQLSLDVGRDNPSWNRKCQLPGCTDPYTYSCDGPTLMRCPPDMTQRSWVDTCITSALCELTAREGNRRKGTRLEGTVDQCAVVCPSPGAFQCDGAELKQCSADQTSWDTITTCASDTQCDPQRGTCSPVPCTPGTLQCNGAELRQCSNQKAWQIRRQCASAALCRVDRCVAPTCPAAGVHRCDGATLQKCSLDLSTWEPQMTCASRALCSARNKRCEKQACLPNEYRCDGQTLERCNRDLTGWNVLSTCAANQICNPSSENPGCLTQCLAATLCDGAELQHCTATGGIVHVANCASAALCNAEAGACEPPVCDAGEHRCNGAQPQVCNANRNGWDNLGRPCATAALCVPNTGTCTAPSCAAGERRCNLAQPQICTTDRTGFQDSGMACVTSDLCAAGVCTPPACSPGDVRCNLSLLQICNDGQTGFRDAAQCATPELCDAGQGICKLPACAVGEAQCTGAQLQLCNTARTGFAITTCASAALCSPTAAACLQPACAAGAKRCEGAVLQHCNVDQTGYEPLEQCASPALCDELAGECDQCVAGEVRCTTDNVREHCDTRGRWTAVENCALTSATCDASKDACVAPPPPPPPPPPPSPPPPPAQ